jgi:protein-tyrosine kinase
VSLIEKAIEKMRANDAAAVSARGRPVPRPVSATSRVDVTSEPAVYAASPTALATSAKKLTINREALREAEYFPEQSCESRFANYYRQIKRPVLQRAFSSPDHPELRLVLVTSALPGDGKSFTSINLALSMARERDSSVLLVDADVPKPNISRILGVANEPGLLDAVVNGSLDPESLVMHTDVPGLEVLPSGTGVEHASELLTSSRMTQVALRLCAANPRRIALFDAPPLLLSSEARALLALPGQVVLVVRTGKTPKRAVQDAVDLIDEQKLTGLVLNDAGGDLNDSYYGYENYGSENKRGASGG